MTIWDERARNDHDFSSVVDPGDRSGLKAAYADLVHGQALAGVLGALPAGTRVLDLGCGAGRALRWPVFAGCDYTGVDPEPTMLELARRRFAGRPRTKFVESRNPVLPFGDGSFDVVFTVWVFQHVKDDAVVRALLDEAHRVLAPTGRLVLLEQVAGRAREQSLIDGSFYLRHRTVEEYRACASRFRLESHQLVPGVSTGLCYKSLNVLRPAFLRPLIPLYVRADARLSALLGSPEQRLRRWCDAIFLFRKPPL